MVTLSGSPTEWGGVNDLPTNLGASSHLPKRFDQYREDTKRGRSFPSRLAVSGRDVTETGEVRSVPAAGSNTLFDGRADGSFPFPTRPVLVKTFIYPFTVKTTGCRTSERPL